MTINNNYQFPIYNRPNVTFYNPAQAEFIGNLSHYTNAELIFGKSGDPFSSPLLQAIEIGSADQFEWILNRVGKESLRLYLRKDGKLTTPLIEMLEKPQHAWYRKAVDLFGREVLLEHVGIDQYDIHFDLGGSHKPPPYTRSSYSIPFLHHLFRTPKTYLKSSSIRYILEVVSIEMLRTETTDGPYKGLTPVHMAFLVGNSNLIDELMKSPTWSNVNKPAGEGPWEGYLPAHVYLQNHLCSKAMPNQNITPMHFNQILKSGPVHSGANEGYLPTHLIAQSHRPERGFHELLKIQSIQCLTEPISQGKNAGTTALQLAQQRPNPAIYEWLQKNFLSPEMQMQPEASQPIAQDPIAPPTPAPVPEPVPAPAPAPILHVPNPMQINLKQWTAQKLALLKRKNPLPLIDQFKKNGLLDYSVYGDAFLDPYGRPNSLFPFWINHPNPEIKAEIEQINSEQFPEGALDDVAGAVFHIHVSLIQQFIAKKDAYEQGRTFIPFLVYTQEGHEVRAHLTMSRFSGKSTLIHGLDQLRANVAIDQVKEILGESPYRFEKGQIVMDLEGFEKLTQHMAKPGLNLIIMPKMPDPVPQEEPIHHITFIQHPLPTTEPRPRLESEPTTLKRKPAEKSKPPKKIKLSKSSPEPAGVDRRTALTDGAKTTYTGEEERVSPPSKRQKQGKLEAVPMGKTVEMPEIAIDDNDPALLLKNMMKEALQGTLNNLKTAKARSALIRREPLPMPITEKLQSLKPIKRMSTLTSLKGYQKDALRQILSLSEQGVMPLLSLEMGLGKTYVFREWILQRILANKGGKHLIIVPASVKEQTQKVFQEGLVDLIEKARKINRGQALNDTGFSSEQLSILLQFPPSSILAPRGKEMQAALQKEHAILIVNYEIVDTLLTCKGHEQLTSIVADEAQRVHNDQSQTQNHLASLARAQQHNDRFRLLMVTATPYENDLKELWTLLSSSNPGLVPEESQKALTVGLQKIKENLVDSIESGEIDTKMLINVYAHYKAFKQILDQVVIYKKTTDPQVIQDWEGKVPTRLDESSEVELAPEVLEALSKATQDLIRTKSQLAFNSKSNAALIHTSLINQSIKEDSSAVQKLYQSAEEGDISSLIEQSSFLKLLFGGEDPVLQRSYRENMKALIFVDHYATGKLIQIGAKRIYGKTVEFFNGQCSHEEKSRLTSWFEDTSEPRVLVLSMQAGGVGLNLPSARLVVDLSQDYNIAQHYQAVARAIRANNEGEIRVLRPLFKGSFYQAHVSAHQARKAQWMQFYFGDGSIESFIEAVVIETKIDRLNQTKNPELTLQGETAIRSSLANAASAMTDKRIAKAVNRASHPLSLPLSPPQSISLDPSKFFQIALPYGTSREDAIRIARAFQDSRDNPLIQAFMLTKQEADKLKIPAEKIRRADPNALQNMSSSCLRRALRIIDDRKNRLHDEPLFGKDFLFRGDQNPPCYLAAEEDQMDEGIYLYKKPLPNGSFHYEPLIAKMD